MNPHFYRLRKETVRKDYAGRATERCERDSLRVVLPVSNSNETRNGGTAACGHLTTVAKQFRAARQEAGLPESLVLYSARHTFGTASPTFHASGGQSLQLGAIVLVPTGFLLSF